VNKSFSLMSEIYDQRYNLIFVAFWWNLCSHVNNCLEIRIKAALTYVIFNAAWSLYSVMCASPNFSEY